MALGTPIAFIIFNRPSVTAEVFEAIRSVRPKRLLVIADGPRSDIEHPDQEAQLVAQTRQIIETVDWECEVLTNFANENMGCKQRVATGLDWAFEQAEELIVLEDDCLPCPTFFPYCEQLLERFRDDPRVMMISGDNFQDQSRTEASYYFSRWAHIWGWASWRRAWQHFDLELSSWPSLKQSRRLQPVFDSLEEYEYWASVLDRQRAGEIDTWDFPWAYACWQQRGLTVLPDQNLVSNLGFGPEATHTQDPSSRLANLPTKPLYELVHPNEVAPNREADRFTWETIFRPVQREASPVRTIREPSWLRKWFSFAK